jgi:hypothetical protein
MVMTRRDGSATVAEALRASPPSLDELRRARIERRVIESMDGRPAAEPRIRRRNAQKFLWVNVAILSAAAALVMWFSRRGADELARFERTGTSAEHGTIGVGTMLEVRETEHMVVQAFGAQFEVSGTPTHMRFRALSREHVDIELQRGSVEVAFHPSERGRERLSIETPNARVEVVGTEFTVQFSGQETRVSVREGVVRVVPSERQDEAVLVHAGDRVAVMDGREPMLETAERSSPTFANPAVVAPPAPNEDPAEHAETREPSPPAPIEPAVLPSPIPPAIPATERLAAARQVLERGEHARARMLLASLARVTDAPIDVRVEAETLMGDSFQASGAAEQAASAYERAASLGRDRPLGHLAIIALARLHERVRLDSDAAKRTYLRYLEEAPSGANARMARDAVCRLGGDPSVECGARAGP